MRRPQGLDTLARHLEREPALYCTEHEDADRLGAVEATVRGGTLTVKYADGRADHFAPGAIGCDFHAAGFIVTPKAGGRRAGFRYGQPRPRTPAGLAPYLAGHRHLMRTGLAGRACYDPCIARVTPEGWVEVFCPRDGTTATYLDITQAQILPFGFVVYGTPPAAAYEFCDGPPASVSAHARRVASRAE